MIVAIQPDTLGSPDKRDNSSLRWEELLKAAGHEVRWVDVFRPDILEQLRGCDGFMWRYAHVSGDRAVAHRLLPVVERELGLCVYPDQDTCWHYDDKITQSYLLKAAGIPVPETWVYWRRDDAMDFADGAKYPLVLKLASGAGSQNVRLLHDAKEARGWIGKLFASGVVSLGAESLLNAKAIKQGVKGAAKRILRGSQAVPEYWFEKHKNYIMFQEFLPDNAFDTRITVIGRRAFGFRRFNRPNDFRASGSGRIDWDVASVDEATVRLGFSVARKLRAQSVAIDGMRRGDDRVVGEISYTYSSWAVADCPGHWELQGEPETGKLNWCEGKMWPEEAQIQDFLVRLKSRK